MVGVMTVHKLSAGDGYTYLGRQVASADERRAACQSLVEYYVARGNPPGVWMGTGAEQLGVVGTEVSEAQMRAVQPPTSSTAPTSPTSTADTDRQRQERSSRTDAPRSTPSSTRGCAHGPTDQVTQRPQSRAFEASHAF